MLLISTSSCRPGWRRKSLKISLWRKQSASSSSSSSSSNLKLSYNAFAPTELFLAKEYSSDLFRGNFPVISQFYPLLYLAFANRREEPLCGVVLHSWYITDALQVLVFTKYWPWLGFTDLGDNRHCCICICVCSPLHRVFTCKAKKTSFNQWSSFSAKGRETIKKKKKMRT